MYKFLISYIIIIKSNELFQTALESLVRGNIKCHSALNKLYSWINQLYNLHYTDPNPAAELFVFDENQVGLIYQLHENENLLEDYFRNGRTPFVLDKRNRIVFYTSSDNKYIWKGYIDNPNMREVCSCITNLCIYNYIYMCVCVCKLCTNVCICGCKYVCIHICYICILFYFLNSYFSHLIMGVFLLLCPMTG